MFKLDAKARIAFGLIGLMVSVLLAASFLGILPDKHSTEMEGRATMAEVLAVNSSALVTQKDIRRLGLDLEIVVGRIEDLLSAGLRTSDGRLIVEIGDHKDQWHSLADGRSSGSQVQVPIWAGSTEWGFVELRFQPIQPIGWFGWVFDPLVTLIGFIALFSFIAFYFYLGKMLKHLDPSNAIPGRVRSALDTMAEGLVVLDSKERIVLSNRAFNTLLNQTFEELLGTSVAALNWCNTDGGELVENEYPWKRALQTGQAEINQRVRLTLAEQPHRTFMINCSPVIDGKDVCTGVLVSFDDVTQLEEQEIELLESKENAEAANNAKSAFLAHMSHEIRTPMNAILGFTELLLRGLTGSEAENQQHLNTVYSSGNHLLNLINDILDLSKVESGKFELDLTDCAPYQIILEIVKVLDVTAKEKNITVGMRVEGSVPEIINSDPGRIRQIVTNLVGNAIKFTDQGQVEVIVNAVKVPDGVAMEIRVVDSGIGMSSDALTKIFEPFVQADSSVTRNFGGTGLGLAISRKFARALGGEIVVSSELGCGSSFSVQLIVPDVDGVAWLTGDQIVQQQKYEESTEKKGWKFSGESLLVVDDVRENRQLATLVMQKYGLVVNEAENGQIALDMTEKCSYDAILMDVQMPVMDGLTAVKEMRNRGLEIPVIALTANAMKGAAQECIEAGFSDYYSKPIKIDTFVAKLAEVLNASEVDEILTGATPVSPSASRIDWAESARSEIRSTLPADDSTLTSLADRFAEGLGQKLGEMSSARVRGDTDALANLAHGLRGAGGTVGFDVFTKPAQNLEASVIAEDTNGVNAAMLTVFELADRIAKVTIPPDVREFYLNLSNARREYSESQLDEVSTDEPLISSIASIPNMLPHIVGFIEQLEKTKQEMEDAWLSRNLEKLAQCARWLKGSGGTMGFNLFTEPAAELEDCAMNQNEGPIPDLLEAIKRLSERVQRPTIVADR